MNIYNKPPRYLNNLFPTSERFYLHYHRFTASGFVWKRSMRFHEIILHSIIYVSQLNLCARTDHLYHWIGVFMKHYTLINGKIWRNNDEMHRIVRYIEQVARVPTPPRPVPPSPPRMGSLKIVFNRNGQWLAVIRGHYRVASRKRERGATHQPQSSSREWEHPSSFSTQRERGISLGIPRPLSRRLLWLYNRPGRHNLRRSSSERNESEPNPLRQQRCVQILHGTSYFVMHWAHLSSFLPAAKVKPLPPRFIYSIFYFPKDNNYTSRVYSKSNRLELLKPCLVSFHLALKIS